MARFRELLREWFSLYNPFKKKKRKAAIKIRGEKGKKEIEFTYGINVQDALQVADAVDFAVSQFLYQLLRDLCVLHVAREETHLKYSSQSLPIPSDYPLPLQMYSVHPSPSLPPGGEHAAG